MTTTASLQGTRGAGPARRPNMVAVGTVVWLSSELMFFAALFAMYFTIRSVTLSEIDGGQWPPADAGLDLPYALTFTTILVLSSFTCQFGVFAAEEGDVFGLRRWFAVTLFMGSVFVLGQLYEYTKLVGEGLTVASSPYGSVFYLTTGFHGLHVVGGLAAFCVVLARSAYGRFTSEQATSAIVVSYYWHFVDVVWIGLFAVIYIIR